MTEAARLLGKQPNQGITSAPKLLIRARNAKPATLHLAATMERLSGCEAVLVLDERAGEQPCEGFPKIGLNEPSVTGLGLYCPPDFAWRCGDYGLYQAANRFPDAPWFWLIEDDVRLLGAEPAEFFRFFADLTEVDFLAGGFRGAEPDWYWRVNCGGRDVRPFRCFFPVTRYSQRAMRLLLETRRSQSRSLLRRRLWPNDEGFVATTMANSALRCADINGFGRTFYQDETFAYRDAEAAILDDLKQGELGDARLVHPVRPESELRARSNAIVRQDTRTFRSRLERRLIAAAVSALPWQTAPA